jgi:hypothetical protein
MLKSSFPVQLGSEWIQVLVLTTMDPNYPDPHHANRMWKRFLCARLDLEVLQPWGPTKRVLSHRAPHLENHFHHPNHPNHLIHPEPRAQSLSGFVDGFGVGLVVWSGGLHDATSCSISECSIPGRQQRSLTGWPRDGG